MLLSTFLVEDKPEIRNTMFESMEEVAPIKFVGHAETESAARQWLRENHANWELVIVDLFLAEGTGFGVLKDCQTRKPTQKVVVLTSYTHRLIASKCMKLGADMVFDKASELDLLVAFCRLHAERLGEVGRTRAIH
ncbi:MAG: response regulator [Polaromonas sp.]|uniref:response regulator n=1 Tax=Polaromonas sp. TaxID=1869339 RepID=UPI00273167F7|nr:response regulator [Polaromonas sp.]MDP1742037.1 response regulator [Polaromonas sp.]MDP3354833.1 response regulator [Polaromonas sp.]